MDSDEAILRLIEKIGSSIGEIQIRSISTLLTKISVGILPFTRLPNFPMLPGVLLQWINSGNHGKSESLLKVLSILYQFARTEEGLVILREYECLEFTEELRTSLLTHDKNVQEYADIAEKIIKALLPLGRVPQQQKKDEAQLKRKDGTELMRKDGTELKREERREESSISLDIITLADNLERTADEKLYRLMIEVKHGRKELQLQSLQSILSLVRYYGEYSFRYRVELVKEVCYCIECAVYPHLCCQILENLFCSSRVAAHCAEDVLIDARAGEITTQKLQTSQIELSRAVFSTVYSHRLYARLVDHCLARPNQPILGWLLQLQYKFAYSPFFRLLSTQKVGDHSKSTLKTLGYYCEAFPQCRKECMELMGKWGLRVEEVPVLQQYAMTQTVQSAYLHLSGYGEEYEVSKHLHEMSELIENLEEGIEGIPHLKLPSLQLKIYFETLMVLTVSVSRQDPLMMHYTQLIKVIHRIAGSRIAIRIPFFEELLGFTNSFDTITYCGKKFVKAQIMVLFIEQQLSHLLQCSLAHQDCSLIFLQTLKKALGMSSRLGGLLGRYSTVLFAVSHHQNENIGSLAHLLLSKVPKKLKMMTAIMQVFSREQERRVAVAKELFQRQCDPLHGMEECKDEKGEKGKKLLKVSVQSIQNLMSIVLQKQLEEAVRVSAGEELIEMLERAEKSTAVQNQVESMREFILAGISGEGHSIRCILFRIIENIRKMSGEAGVAPEILLSYLISIPQFAEFQLARRALLSLLYVNCFQSPFSRTPSKHYSMLCYPHVQMANLPIQQLDIPVEVVSSNVGQSVSSEQDNLEMGSFKGYCESVTRRVVLLGSSWLVGQPHFVQQIEKQVGIALHHQVEDQLHLVSYLVKGSSVPPQSLSELASTLSNALLSRDAHPLAQEILHLLSLFRLKPNKQIRSILTEREGVLELAASLSELDSETLAVLMRKAVDTPIQKVLLVGTVLRNLKNIKLREWQEYTRALLFGLVLRSVKSEDGLLRRTSLVLARELVAVRDHYECMLQQQICMGTTVSALLCETKLTGEQFCMLMEIVVECVATEQKPLQYLVHTVVQLLRIPPSLPSTLIFTTVLNVLNSLVARKDILQGVDVSDTLISLLSAYSRNYTNHDIGFFQQEEDLLLMAACFKHLYLCSHTDPACIKYYLSSTNIVQLIATVSTQIHPETSHGAMQVLVASLSQLMFALTEEEDLLVYKLSQQVGNVFEMLYNMFPFGGKEYCDMFGWVTVIWWKGRTLLDSTSLGVDIAKKALQYGVAGMKAMVSVTYSAKIVLVNSSQLMEILRVAGEQIETVMVKQIKGRKKGSPSKAEHHQQIQYLEETLHLLTALFHSVDHLGQTAELTRDNVKKVILFMDKNYGFLTEHVGTVYLQALTNLSNSNVFSVWFATYLSEGHSLMLEDIMTTLARNDGSSVTPQVKRAFHILRILVPHESARSSVTKCRLLEELIGRLTKSMDEKKAQLNLNHFYEIVQLLAALARFKDTSAKIISDKKMLELLLRHLVLQRSVNLEEKIVILLSNLSCFKGNKATLMANRDLHKVTLGLLSENVPYSSHLVRLIYNLIYKNSAGVKLYRRKEVVEIVERSNEGSEVYRALLDVLAAED